VNLFGLSITRTKAAANLRPIDGRGTWWPIVTEGRTGDWQRNIEIRLDNVLSHPTVFACITLIAGDVGKTRLCLKEEDGKGIWTEREVPAYSPVLRKPNRYQTIAKFFEQWMISKLVWGNTYVLKERDNRGVVVALYILDPNRVRPLVSISDGSVYYELMRDPLSGLAQDRIVAPAREIIHDPMYTFYHPLVGLPPLYASGLLATLGLNIVTSSASFFANGSNPGGILTAPAGITDEQATALKTSWEAAFSGDNAGKVAVLGGELKYEPLAVPSDKAQLTEQWGKTSEAIATCFHVPFHFVGGPLPPYNNVQTLTVQYFTLCLQALFRQCELVLDEGLGLGRSFENRYGTEFDIDDLLLMDSLTRAETATKAIGSGLSYNESRFKYFDVGPVAGGDSPLAQQQYYSLEALARRDATQPPPPTESPALPPAPDDAESKDLSWDDAHRRYHASRRRAA
jgi:HK97 family phage portal protein